MRLNLIAGLLLAALLGACAGGASFPNVTPGAPVTITGQLYRPEGPGPFPAMVLLHGCGGVEPLHARWAKWLTERGHVALVVDSWAPRGMVENCSRDTPDVERTERFDDAFGALRYLQSRPFVDPRRIGAMGWSNGGVFAMAVINGPSLERARRRGVTLPPIGFRLGIGIHPGGCFSLVEDLVIAPLRVLIGEADDWTPARLCAEMVNAMRAKGADATITIYPGAYHYFDNADYALQVFPQTNPAVFAFTCNLGLSGPAAVRLYEKKAGRYERSVSIDQFLDPDFDDAYLKALLFPPSGGELFLITVSGRTDSFATGTFTLWAIVQGEARKAWIAEALPFSSYELSGFELRMEFCEQQDEEKPEVCRQRARERYTLANGEFRRTEHTILPAEPAKQ